MKARKRCPCIPDKNTATAGSEVGAEHSRNFCLPHVRIWFASHHLSSLPFLTSLSSTLHLDLRWPFQWCLCYYSYTSCDFVYSHTPYSLVTARHSTAVTEVLKGATESHDEFTLFSMGSWNLLWCNILSPYLIPHGIFQKYFYSFKGQTLLPFLQDWKDPAIWQEFLKQQASQPQLLSIIICSPPPSPFHLLQLRNPCAANKEPTCSN